MKKNLISILKEHEPDIIVLAGFMRIIKSEFLSLYPNKIINIHPSLLPKVSRFKCRKQALDAGVSETGCTVHYVDNGIDTGKTLAKESAYF